MSGTSMSDLLHLGSEVITDSGQLASSFCLWASFLAWYTVRLNLSMSMIFPICRHFLRSASPALQQQALLLYRFRGRFWSFWCTAARPRWAAWAAAGLWAGTHGSGCNTGTAGAPRQPTSSSLYSGGLPGQARPHPTQCLGGARQALRAVVQEPLNLR